MKTIGITGQIGCGKTTIAKILKDEGFVVFDTDKVCRQLYYDDRFLAKIKQFFPESFASGFFDKPTLRRLVFADKKRLKELESLTHPFLKQKFLSFLHKFRFYRGFLFVDAALLYELGFNKHCAATILAVAPVDVQRKRVILRDNISADQFDNIVQIQSESAAKLSNKADFVINTDKPLGILKVELIKLIGVL